MMTPVIFLYPTWEVTQTFHILPFRCSDTARSSPPNTGLNVGVEPEASGTDQNIGFQMHFFSIVFQREGRSKRYD